MVLCCDEAAAPGTCSSLAEPCPSSSLCLVAGTYGGLGWWPGSQ